LEVEGLLDLAAAETRSDPVVFVPQMGLVVVQAFPVFQEGEKHILIPLRLSSLRNSTPSASSVERKSNAGS
jgi:hypothetical protein